MPSPLNPFKPVNVQVFPNPQASTAAAGTLSTYTVPVGKIARLVAASVGGFVGGAPTVAFQHQRGVGVTTIWSGTAQQMIVAGHWLLANDIVRWQCTAGVAATTVDTEMVLEEYEAA